MSNKTDVEVSDSFFTTIDLGNSEWWREEYGFFGELYFNGDHSLLGYLDSVPLPVPERSVYDVNGLISLLGLQEGQRLLDVPCGYGRHSVQLAARGFDVTGIDINSFFLDKAAEAARSRGVSLKLRSQDMRSLDYDQEFGAVLNLCYSFGFFRSEEENMRVLENFYKALKPGGKYLMNTDVNMPRVRQGTYKFNEERELVNGGKLIIRERYNPATRRMDGVWTVSSSDGTEQTNDYSVRVYEEDEFRDLCLKAGFSSCQVYSSWSAAPYDPEAEEIYFVAVK